MIRRPPRSTLLSLHDALPISQPTSCMCKSSLLVWGFASTLPWGRANYTALAGTAPRSEEHTSELQSQSNLVCRLLLEKKNAQRLDAGTTQNTNVNTTLNYMTP